MKKHAIAFLVLFLAACGGLKTSGSIEPAITLTVATFSDVSGTPTRSEPIATTSIPTTETAGPLHGTSIPTSTPRVNEPLESGTGIRMTSIQMFDSQKGWGFDSDYHVLRTRKGGRTWQDVTPPTGYYDPAGFFALDADTAWATFMVVLYSHQATAHVWHTEDGGETWTQSQEFRLNMDQYGEPYSSEFYLPRRMQFVDRDTGWLAADVSYNMNSARPLLFHTTDGGDTWQTINSRIEFPDSCVGIGFVFMDSNTGWVGGNCFAQGVVSNKISFFVLPDGWGIYKTLDGGRSYEQKTFMPIPEEFEELDLFENDGNCGEIRLESFAEDVIGIEWGCSIFTSLEPDFRFFALSADHGQTWTSWKSTGNEFFLDGEHGWRLFSPGALQQSKDGGANWTTVKNVTWDDADFDFVGEQEGWAIAKIQQAKALLHTTDGGQTWQDLHPLVGP